MPSWTRFGSMRRFQIRPNTASLKFLYSWHADPLLIIFRLKVTMGVVAGIFFLSEYWVYMSIYFTHYFLDQEKASFQVPFWLAKSFDQWKTESENWSKPVQGGRPVNWFRNGIFWKYARDYFPVMCVKEPKQTSTTI